MAKQTRWKVWANQRTSRNQNWTENETATLIKVWVNHLDVLKLHRRTGKIYEKMAAEFAQCGFTRTPTELQKKVSNLTQEYRKEKMRIKKGFGPSRWRYYDSVEEIVSQLSASRFPLSASHKAEAAQSKSSKEPDTDNNMDEVKFMTVYLNEKSGGEEEGEEEEASNPELQMPVIVSVESQHPDQKPIIYHSADNQRVLQDLKTDMQRVVEQSRSNQPVQTTLVFRPNLQESANNTVLKDLKTEMHRVLKESLDMHGQQVKMQQRQIVLQEDMLKIMAKFIDNCP